MATDWHARTVAIKWFERIVRQPGNSDECAPYRRRRN
jgi:hypothetical protein